MPKDSNLSCCTLYLVRHAETESNLHDIITGTTDAPLTANGVAQSQAVHAKLHDIEFAAAYASDLGRARHTAEIILQGRSLQLQLKPALRERDYGIYEGKTSIEFITNTRQFWESLTTMSLEEQQLAQYPGGIESTGHLIARVVPCLQQIAQDNMGQNVLVVSHGAVLRNFLIHIGYAAADLPPGSLVNGQVIVVESDGISFQVQRSV